MEASKFPFVKPESAGGEQRPGGEPSSATGVFGQVSAAPVRSEDDLLASLMHQGETREAAPPEPVKETPVAVPAAAEPTKEQAATSGGGPGEFTRMLQALTTPENSAGLGADSAANRQSVSRVFSHVPMEKKAEPPDGAGDAERLARAAEGQSSPAVRGEVSGAGSAGPGAFTRMFSSMSASGASSAPPAPAPVQSAPPATSAAAGASAGPGEFTRMFSAMNTGSSGAPTKPEVAEPKTIAAPAQPAQHSGGGDFTRMFSSQAASHPSQEDPLKSLKPEPMRESGLRFTGAPAPVAPAAPAAAGGFTQLLQALSEEAAPKSSPPPMSPVPPVAPPPGPAAGGGFTQLLQSLSEQPAAPLPVAQPPVPATPPAVAVPPTPPLPPPVASTAAVPPTLPPSVPPPVASGPGEFTRVISGSALRDLQGQGAVAAPPPPPPPSAPPAWAAPQMPKPPAPPAAAPFSPPAFGFPAAAPTPPPPVPVPAQPPSTLQKYLPLILVVNVFLLLVIVLILIFVMHHK